jgi:hypothetical protein
MGAALKEANFSLAGVYYSAGDNIKYQVNFLSTSFLMDAIQIRVHVPTFDSAIECTAETWPLGVF